jgi:tetratricopeptide (TPR) repeat protein
MSLGRLEEAQTIYRRQLKLLDQHLELNPEDPRACILGAAAYANLHIPDRAIELAERAMAVDPEDPMLLYNVACTYAQLGKTEESLAALERAVEKGWGDKNWIEHDADLDPIREDPRFKAIVESM